MVQLRDVLDAERLNESQVGMRSTLQHADYGSKAYWRKLRKASGGWDEQMRGWRMTSCGVKVRILIRLAANQALKEEEKEPQDQAPHNLILTRGRRGHQQLEQLDRTG